MSGVDAAFRVRAGELPEGQLAPFCKRCGERLYPDGLGEFDCPDCGETWLGAMFDLGREARINASVDVLLAPEPSA